MHSVVGFTVFGVDWEFLKPYIVLGLALGGVYALSGVGLVVLYQATGVLNIAFGAVGAAGALIAYYLIKHTGTPDWLAFLTCILFGGVVSLLYGLVFGPAFAARDPLVKMMGTLGPRSDPARPHGLAGANRRSLRTVPDASDLEPPLRAPRGDRELDAGDRARVRDRAHRVDDALPPRHEPRHRDAGARQRPRDHRHARRAGAAGRGRRPGSAPGSSAAQPVCCWPTCSRRSTMPP